MTEIVTATHEQTRGCVFPGKAATLLLSTDGVIVGVNEEGTRLLDYSVQLDDWLHVSQMLPGLAKTGLLEKKRRTGEFLFTVSVTHWPSF